MCANQSTSEFAGLPHRTVKSHIKIVSINKSQMLSHEREKDKAFVNI